MRSLCAAFHTAVSSGRVRSLAVTCGRVRSRAVVCGRVRSSAVSQILVRSGAAECSFPRSRAVECGRVRSSAVPCGRVRSSAVVRDRVRSCAISCGREQILPILRYNLLSPGILTTLSLTSDVDRTDRAGSDATRDGSLDSARCARLPRPLPQTAEPHQKEPEPPHSRRVSRLRLCPTSA